MLAPSLAGLNLWPHQAEGLEFLTRFITQRLSAVQAAELAWERAGRPLPPTIETALVAQAKGMCGALLAWEPGLGKTRVALSLLAHYQDVLRQAHLDRFTGKPNIVLAPARVLISWQQEAEAVGAEGLYFITNPRAKDVNEALAHIGPGETLLIPYSTLRARAKDTDILSVRWGLLIADEVQALQNPKAQQTRAAWRLIADFRIGLSGTPYTSRIPQLYWVLAFLQGYTRATPRNARGRAIGFSGLIRISPVWSTQANFLNLYAVTHLQNTGFRGGYRKVKVFVRAKNLTHRESRLPGCYGNQEGHEGCMALHPRMTREVMHRKRREECLDLPPIVHQTVTTPMTTRQFTIYHQVAAGIIQWYEEEVVRRRKVENPLTRLLYAFEAAVDIRQLAESLRRATDDPCATYIGRALEDVPASSCSGKLNELKDMLETGLLDDEKALLFTEFSTTAHILARELAAYNPVLLVGGLTHREFAEAIRRFTYDDSCRLAIATRAAHEGLNLQAASIVILYGKVGWTPASVLQAIKRAHRPGQTRPVTAIHMVTPHSVEVWLYKLLAEKAHDLDTALDGNPVTEDAFAITIDSSAQLKSILAGK